MPQSRSRPRTEAISNKTARAPVAVKLRVISGADFGLELVLERGTYRIGKDPAGDFVITDPAVSHLHLLAEVLDSGVRLSDQGSTNGSFCEGMRFSSLEVKPGATVRIGRTVLKVAPATEPKPALEPSKNRRFGELVGDALCMRELFAVLERLAKSDTDVLLTGETGTGKELAARSLHAQSSRSAGPFVVTGAVGRYFYSLVPSSEGRAQELGELTARWERLKVRVGNMTKGTTDVTRIGELLERASLKPAGSLTWQLVRQPLQRLRDDRDLLRVRSLFKTHGHWMDFVSAYHRMRALQVQVGFFKSLRGLMSAWRLFHVVLAVLLVVLITAHIAVSIFLGYTWIFR